MEREFLKSLGLEKEVIDTIMREYGKDMTEKLGTINDLAQKTNDLETKLGGYSDYDAIKQQLTDAQNELTTFKETSAKEIEASTNALNAMKLSHAIDLAVEREHTRDTKAFMAHLDTTKLSLDENGGLVGFDEQAKTIHENQAYLFEQEKASGVPSGTLDSESGKTLSMLDAVKSHYQ